jgi:transcriptional antiterminator NusG
MAELWPGNVDTVERSASCDARWYALQIRPRFEKKAASQLRSKGIETFLPLLRQIRWWSDRRKLVETPLFSGYEFVHILLSPEERLLVLRTPGVMNFVGFPCGASPVAETQIESLRRLLSTRTECSIRAFLRSGQKVRIRGGALDGVEGILQEDAKHLIVSIDCIQRSVAVRIEGYELEAA